METEASVVVVRSAQERRIAPLLLAAALGAVVLIVWAATTVGTMRGLAHAIARDAQAVLAHARGND